MTTKPSTSSEGETAPGDDILIVPKTRLILNGPFIEEQVCRVQLINDGARQIGWAIRMECQSWISLSPDCGVINAHVSLLN